MLSLYDIGGGTSAEGPPVHPPIDMSHHRQVGAESHCIRILPAPDLRSRGFNK